MAGKGLPGIVKKILSSTQAPLSIGESVHEGREGGTSAAERGKRFPDTPVVVVRSAGLPDQRVWRSTLKNIVADTLGQDLSPCVVIVGSIPSNSILVST
jgi:precorrin-4 methylase